MEDFGGLVKYFEPEELAKLAPEIKPEEAGILDAINQKVAGAESFEKIMDFFYEATQPLLRCDRVGVAFLEDEGRRLVARWARAEYEPVLLGNGYSEGISGSTLEEILKSGRIRVISDLQKYLDIKPQSESSRILVEEGIRSSMTCPLMVEGRIVGLLFRDSCRVNAYGSYQALLHSRLAERLSQAVEKAYRISQLTAANKAYMELLAFAAHELNSPLAAMTMNADLLLEGYVGDLTPAQREKIEAIKRRAQGLMDNTREYLDLARYEGGNFKLRARFGLDLRAEVLTPVLESFRPLIEGRKIRLSIVPEEGAFSVDCDPSLMRLVFANLIGNAVKYGEENGQIRLGLGIEDGRFKATVWNTGAGFPEEERIKLFKRFSRLSIPEFKKVRGTGVGLYLTWQVVGLHGGRIRADSEYGKWAQFDLEIPQGDKLRSIVEFAARSDNSPVMRVIPV